MEQEEALIRGRERRDGSVKDLKIQSCDWLMSGKGGERQMTERGRGGQVSFLNQSRESLTSGKGVRGRILRRQEAQSSGVETF